MEEYATCSHGMAAWQISTAACHNGCRADSFELFMWVTPATHAQWVDIPMRSTSMIQPVDFAMLRCELEQPAAYIVTILL
jgi:hypothetical protein